MPAYLPLDWGRAGLPVRCPWLPGSVAPVISRSSCTQRASVPELSLPQLHTAVHTSWHISSLRSKLCLTVAVDGRGVG